MNKTFRKILSLIMIIAILFSINIPVQAAGGGGSETGILEVKGDGVTPKEHQALSMTVDSVASTSSLQAFCVGWTFTFSNSSGSVKVYVPLSSVNTEGGTRTYTFPLTTGWTKGFTGISGGKSIRDLVSNKTAYDKIIKDGCTVHADARIRKYSYSNGKYTALNTYANSELEIDSNFSEFTSNFKNNTKNDYFDLNRTLAPEPPDPKSIPTPSVTLTLPIHESTVYVGTTVKFEGYGTGCHHIGGFVDGKFIGEQQNPNDDITQKMYYKTTYKLDQIRDYTFQIKGRNTVLATDDGSILAESEIHIVHVIALPPNSGDISIKCLNYETNTEIPSTAQTITGVKFGEPQTINYPELTGFDIKGSYQSDSPFAPEITDMQEGVNSQIVTLSTTKENTTVYFWYNAKAEEPVIEKCDLSTNLQDTTVTAGEYVSEIANTYDSLGHNITSYSWGAAGANEKVINNDSIKLMYMTPGVYNLILSVTCSDNNNASASCKITVIEPIPISYIDISGKTKENRKINIDASRSTSGIIPMDWTKTTWKIEPLVESGAKWEMGVRLSDGTVKTIDQNTDQSLLNGQNSFSFQARYSGIYQVTSTVANTNSITDTVVNVISVSPDLAPVAVFNNLTYHVRDQENPLGSTYPKWAKTLIYDNGSYSPDGDTIKTRIWGFRYDSDNAHDANNNPIFTDKPTVYKYTDDPTTPFLQSEGQRLVVDSDNAFNVEFWNYFVGHTAYELTVIEDIPESETIKELLVDSDYRRGCTKDW